MRWLAFTTVVLIASLWSISVRAGAWTLKGGELWLKQSVGFWHAPDRFASTIDSASPFSTLGSIDPGDRIPFDPTTGGRFQSVSTTFQAQLGLVDWWQIGFTFPLIWADFDETETADTVRANFGLGDVRLSTQARLPLRMGPFAVSGRLEIKLPTGDFVKDSTIVPLTEGQLDVETWLSGGVSLYPYGYANVELGYRFRAEDQQNRNRGDEFLFVVESGIDLPWDLMLKLAFDGLVGGEGSATIGGAPVQGPPRRRLFTVWTGLLWRVLPRLLLELQGRYLIAGEDFPTGFQIYSGVSYTFTLWGRRKR